MTEQTPRKTVTLSELVNSEEKHTRALELIAYRHVFKSVTPAEKWNTHNEAYRYIDGIHPLKFIRLYYEAKYLKMIKEYAGEKR